MSPDMLVKAKEETEELGGYFIVNGIEKIIRMLQVNRRNYPMAIKRGAFTNRGPGYTPYGIQHCRRRSLSCKASFWKSPPRRASGCCPSRFA